MMTAVPAIAQTPAPPPPPAPPPAPEPTVVVAPPGSAVVVTPPAAAPAAPAPAPANWYDKFSADAFVDAYASYNANGPKPQGPTATSGGTLGGNAFRAFDVAQGFSLNWLGVNASYAADPIGGTIGLRFGPGTGLYNAGPDNANGLQYVKQAFATWKPASKLQLDFGKFDQPFGSEVADSQLNMNYTRTVLFWFMQPLFFTGLRATIPVADQFSILAFAANGWNNSIDNNRGKTFGAQVMIKPVDQLILYVGYVGGPEQNDVAAGGAMMPPIVDVPNANDHWRHMIDFVADINPTKELRLLLNYDYRTEDTVATGPGGHSAVVYGGNLVARYAFTDAFSASIRGEWYHDEHGDTLGLTGQKVDIEDGTITLMYGIGNHLAFMLDGRMDFAQNDATVNKNKIFQENSNGVTDNQFTATLGVIASTK
jgi:hypothetical protein